MVDVKVSSTSHKILEAPKSVIIKVGILGGRMHFPKARGKKTGDPIPMAKLIAWLEAGFSFRIEGGKRVKNGGKKVTIPPRPILVPGIEKGLDGLRKDFKKLAAALAEGKSGDTEIARIGIRAVGSIQEYVDEDLPSIAPNAESTIKVKGTSAGAGGNTPMIDEGQLMGAITYSSEKKD